MLISIHLMLMLILDNQVLLSRNLHFNTSHVNVNRSGKNPVGQLAVNFNTSHVNVNLTETV